MSPACPKCGHNVPYHAAACPECGAPAPVSDVQAAGVAEVTALDYFRTSEMPKALRDLCLAAQTAAETLATSLGGSAVAVKPFVFEAVFGSPEGRQAAAAAAEWALRLRGAFREILAENKGGAGARLSFRAGADAKRDDNLPHGETPLTSARRLKAKAGDGDVLVGENVYLQSADLFKFHPVGFFQSRGGAAVKIYRAEDEDLSAGIGLTAAGFRIPLADTEEKVAAFLKAAETDDGVRHLRITGPPGSGKTSVLETCERLARDRGWVTAATSCYGRRRGQPYAAWGPLWRELFSHLGGKLPGAIGRTLAAFGGDADVWTPLFESVLGFEARDNPYVQGVPPYLRRRALREITGRLAEAVAKREALLFLWDDAHEADAASQALLVELLAGPPPGRVAFAYVSPERNDVLRVGPEVAVAARAFNRSELDAVASSGPGVALREAIEKGRGNAGVTVQLWLLARERPEAFAEVAAATPSVLAAVLGQRCRLKSAEWRRLTAALALLGLPVAGADLEAWAQSTAAGGDFDAAAWVSDLQAMAILTRPPGGTDTDRRISPHVAAALADALITGEEERRQAANACARFLEEKMPAELAAAAALEAEGGNYAGAATCAFEQAERAAWLDATTEELSQLNLVVGAAEEKPGSPALPPRVRARAYYDRARVRLDKGEAAAALADLDRAAPWAEPELSAAIPLLRGRAFAARRDYGAAAAAFRQAADIAGAAGDGDSAAAARVDAARLWLGRGEIAKAAAANAAPLPEVSAQLCAAAADIHLRTGSVAKAVRSADAALARADEEADPVGAAAAALEIAPTLFENGRLAQYRYLLTKSRAVWSLVGDRRRECDVMEAAATLDALTEPLTASAASWFAVLETAQAEEYPKGITAAAAGLARCWLLQNDGRAAGHWLNRARESCNRLLPSTRAALELIAAEISFYADGAAAEAKTHAAAAARAARAAGDVPRALRADLFGARVDAAAGREDEARKVLGHEEFSRFASESRPFFASFACLAGHLREAAGDRDGALKFLRAGTAAARELGMWAAEAECLQALGSWEEEAHRREGLKRRCRWLWEHAGAELFLDHSRAATPSQN